MKKLLMTLAASALLAACGSSSPECTKKTCSDVGANCGSPSDGCGGTLSCGSCTAGLSCGTGSNNSIANVCGFAQPAGTVAVDFKVDDSTNKLYQGGQLDWKGQFAAFDAGTRIIVNDASWAGGNGPYPQLYDDGPWNKGGHEPATATAGDHIFGVTVFTVPPATGTSSFGFGLQDAYYRANWTTIAGVGETPDGWMWVGDNGSFSVAAGATGTINAGSVALTPAGNIDVQLVIDTNALATDQAWNKTKVQVKSNAWYWGTVTLKDDGSTYGDATASDGKFTFVLSKVVPTPFVHTGLEKTGNKMEFIFLLNGVEYKNASGQGHPEGVSVGTRTGTSGSFTAGTITIATNKNSQLVIP